MLPFHNNDVCVDRIPIGAGVFLYAECPKKVPEIERISDFCVRKRLLHLLYKERDGTFRSFIREGEGCIWTIKEFPSGSCSEGIKH
ncbi:hypothetical protein PM3016_1168 [Paenibacillus mucilaginosus 3016]|uniref:Uncharacterized protein n=1 Tax=Paenibacillus mucilaginosus 3016 TaxID=1116391 RepID=H6NEF5_9BACL|nr:hypothetical protein PM3016_1168 [Paenibacillus mucilaginosus 3016]